MAPNPFVNLTRYGRRRKPGRASFQHPTRQGLRHQPTRIRLLRTLGITLGSSLKCNTQSLLEYCIDVQKIFTADGS